MRQFPSSPIASLLDETPRYDLAESTAPDLGVEELLGADGLAELTKQDLGYATSAGQEQLRELLAANLGVTGDQVLVTAGAASALFLLGLLVADDGEVVVVRPCFPPTADALHGLGATVVTATLGFDDGYRLDADAVASALSPATRMVMVASPQNPSGVRLADDDVDRLLAAMARTCPDAVLLVDETFREATYGDEPVPPSLAGRSPRVVTCGSLSKAHGAGGLRIGWLTTSSPEFYEQLRLAKFTSSIACGRLDEVLAARLLERAGQLLGPRRAFLAEARAVVAEFVDAHADRFGWVRPDAGAFCCLRLHPHAVDDAGVRRFYAELARRRVAVAPGTWFGDDDRVFRLGFGHESLDGLRAGLDEVAAAAGE